LSQILINLISNAIKFTEQGNITLTAAHEPIPTLKEEVSGDFSTKGTGLTMQSVKELKLIVGLESALTPEDEEAIVYFGTDTGLGLHPEKMTLATALELSPPRAANLHLSVKDTGIGMDSEELARLFDRFAQANRRTNSRYGGSGLGLSISKKLVELMGGSIRVESQKGQGSQFSVIVKCSHLSEKEHLEVEDRKRTHESTEKSLTAQLKGKEILVVDDNIINQMVLVMLLEQVGCSCQVANNGKEALEKHEKMRFDLIFMDIEMPIMGGLEATKRIRDKEQQLGYRTPIIGLSGHTREYLKGVALQAGIDVYMTKPYAKEELYSTIIQHTITEQKLPQKAMLTPQFSSNSGLGRATSHKAKAKTTSTFESRVLDEPKHPAQQKKKRGGSTLQQFEQFQSSRRKTQEITNVSSRQDVIRPVRESLIRNNCCFGF